ncbi:putative glycerol-3-phosphate acyltransferase [Vibrio chagasii]|jgi:glycerol-3-phosphate acyltransferase PlsY|uniref:Glycerol-3-phosphate acyltransferase n=1 Tax=Vibrio chagasii TaxID=170679 RepID=A0A7V7NVI1_9VIBR|nr:MULTISPECIES: glycerol-3-phosphate 1-O-acyltransferase PlsY [Vibrio]MDE9382669.1 glycerol-3-phosphate 1-O-acyltransferase PlsY [Vibrio alginolyticus]KAB0481073.1 glycerol-3-phosphate 1-O-acyltransferase PlsY [Vibrio chagasii]KZX66607.1 glycerol-3-phosphate acyltransferase [Vibrio sp. HI00D65]MBJ2145627.1 glycerol-3-phosphate 1-O-acyltransferase PlsY [Vibrio sp. IB15]MCG9562799.1 glycerol-3-phosphate 1-O-acyltransferase PlsY [Vibrio chagasii]|tara:strand:- start:519 stop:1115 length:597 start_codon:yes stop_codon:yes gene_type:complete
MTPLALIMIIAAYLLGSISSAVLICRVLRLPDPRTVGSNNPGATNVLRVGGKGAAAAVLLCDMLKGTIPVWLGYFLGIDSIILGIVAIAACLGHMYPIFFHFKGGKGVATALGAIAPIGFDLTGMIMATWLVVALLFRYSSLAALVTVLLAPFYAWLVKPQYTLPVAMLCCLIVLRHHQNIRRLLDGSEPKLGQKKSA